MRRQSIKRGVWYIGRCKKQQTGGFFPSASLAGQILVGLAGPILKKIKGGWQRRRQYT